MVKRTAMGTRLRYLDEMDRLELESIVGSVTGSDERVQLALEETVFYPQGGGQPYDQGWIVAPSGRFRVEEVRMVEGQVLHFGRFESGGLAPGDHVSLQVDPERRRLHTRIHSGGHLVDMAVTALGLGWIPGKGYHFPQGPYVEYSGVEGQPDRELLKNQIEDTANELVRSDATTEVRWLSREQIAGICAHVPDYVSGDGLSRVVFYGEFGVPCGGTHVARLSEVGRIVIRKIKPGGEGLRVSYAVA